MDIEEIKKRKQILADFLNNPEKSLEYEKQVYDLEKFKSKDYITPMYVAKLDEIKSSVKKALFEDETITGEIPDNIHKYVDRNHPLFENCKNDDEIIDKIKELLENNDVKTIREILEDEDAFVKYTMNDDQGCGLHPVAMRLNIDDYSSYSWKGYIIFANLQIDIDEKYEYQDFHNL